MLTLVGWLVVTGCVIGGFLYSGGNLMTLVVLGEYIIIIGVCIGFLISSTPASVLKLMLAQILTAFKGSPYGQATFMDMITAMYELFMVAREQGVIGIEDHVMNPKNSSIFQKYPSFISNGPAVAFMQDALKPLIDGRVKGEQIKGVLHEEMHRMHLRNHAPSDILTKIADALPGVGIVAAVLGIIITMSYIAGDKATIGAKVAHALVGTFIGLLLSYGYMQPLIAKISFNNEDEESYFQALSAVIVSYATGAPPIMAAESGRRIIPPDRQPTSDDMEATLKAVAKKGG